MPVTTTASIGKLYAGNFSLIFLKFINLDLRTGRGHRSNYSHCFLLQMRTLKSPEGNLSRVTWQVSVGTRPGTQISRWPT